MFKNSFGEYCKWYKPVEGREFRNKNTKTTNPCNRIRMLKFTGIFTGAALVLLPLADANNNKENNIFSFTDWTIAFKDYDDARAYVTNRNNYKVLSTTGAEYYYFKSTGDVGLFKSGKKGDNASTSDSNTIKDWFIDDMRQSLNMESYWMPVNHPFQKNKDVWKGKTNDLSYTSLYDGSSLNQYFVGAHHADATKTETKSSLNEAIASLLQANGVTYNYDSNNFTSTSDMYAHFLANQVVNSDVNRFKFIKPYVASNGALIQPSTIHDTATAAVLALRQFGDSYEESLVKPWLWTTVAWETTDNYRNELNDWILKNTIEGSEDKLWVQWGENNLVKSLYTTKKPDYLQGVPANITNHDLPIWNPDVYSSGLWQIFSKSNNLAKFAQTKTIMAYQCKPGGGVVSKNTKFLNDFKELWTDFKLNHVKDFDTEVLGRLCEGGDPIYNVSTGGARTWINDFFGSPWLLDPLWAAISPAGTPGYTPGPEEYEASVEYTSDYNRWKIEKDKEGFVNWNNNPYPSQAHARNAIQSRTITNIDNTYVVNEPWYKSTFTYPVADVPGAVIQSVESSTITGRNSLLKARFYSDSVWTVTGGDFTIKADLKNNDTFKNLIIGAPTNAQEEDFRNWFRGNIPDKWSKPGQETTQFNLITEYDKNRKIDVAKNFNNSSVNIYKHTNTNISKVRTYIYDNHRDLNFILTTREGQSAEKIILVIDHIGHEFDSIEESLAYWEAKMQQREDELAIFRSKKRG